MSNLSCEMNLHILETKKVLSQYLRGQAEMSDLPRCFALIGEEIIQVDDFIEGKWTISSRCEIPDCNMQTGLPYISSGPFKGLEVVEVVDLRDRRSPAGERPVRAKIITNLTR